MHIREASATQHKCMKTAQSLVALATCLWCFAGLNVFSQAAETPPQSPAISPQRFRELEKAVQAIQQENQKLRQENGHLRNRVDDLEHKRAIDQPAVAVAAHA